jgi:pimeloyl-ACP methyl ester carboxylesterase
MFRIIPLFVIFSTALLFLSPVNNAQAIPTYKTIECKFEVPAERDVQCGYLFVPENRADPNSRMIRVHVAVIKALNPNPNADPVVYLNGGPGGHTLARLASTFDAWFAPFAEDRDFIVLDQRGVGLSEPALTCPEVMDMRYANMNVQNTQRERRLLHLEAVQACRARLVEEGVYLEGYTTAASAADLADLRIALGVDEWNVYGTSYGSRLALTMLRDFPEGVRSVVLDAPVPLQGDFPLNLPAHAERAFRLFFESCAIDPGCDFQYPNLERQFYETAERMNGDVVRATAESVYTGEQHELLISGDMFIDFLFNALYSTPIIPYLPLIINDTANGDYRILATFVLQDLEGGRYSSTGMYYSVQCAEEVSFFTAEQLDAEQRSYPHQQDIFALRGYADVCDVWNVAAAPAIENEAVTSDIPALVFTGEFDPITPPDNGREVVKTLSNGYFFEFVGIGHGASIAGDCPRAIMLSFLDDPTREPDRACMRDMRRAGFFARK